MKRVAVGACGFALWIVVGCSIETKASDVICVANQIDICTNCARPDGDTRSYRGQHTCAADGKSFGECTQCAPVTGDEAPPKEPPSKFEPLPKEPDGKPTGPAIDAACNKKMTMVAGRDDVADQFVFAGVVMDGRFQMFSSSGAPMRSHGAFVINEGALMGVYRTKGNALVTSTFKNGAWEAPSAIPSASTDTAPTIATWGKKNKVIFRANDGRYNAVDWEAGAGAGAWSAVEVIGATTQSPPAGASAPTGTSVGAPGVKGAGVMFGYTDGLGGLYRQDWNGTSWRSAGIRSTVVTAAAMRTALISMNGGAFDLVSAFVASDGAPYIATRAVRDNSSEWSNPIKMSDVAKPLDGVNGVALSGGRALFVYRDDAKKAWYIVFDPSKEPAFTAPKELVLGAAGGGGNPALASTPYVSEDRCGADAVLAYAEEGGAVAVMRFAGDAWKGPFLVGGISKMTYALAAVVP